MKLHYRLWIIFTLLFVAVSFVFAYVIIRIYEERVLKDQENVVVSQGLTIVERVRGTKFTEQAEGYLAYYSERLNSRLFLLDQENHVLIDSYKQFPEQTYLSLEILRENQPLPKVKFVPTQEYGYVQYTLLAVDPNKPMAGKLLMVRDVNFVSETIRSFQVQVFAMMIGAVILFFFICYGIAAWFTKPIRRIIQQLKGISPLKREFQMKYKRRDEIGELVRGLEQMVAQLNGYDQRQRQFMSVSSHELKTPLATMQLISENLPIVRENAEMHQDFINDLAAQINKMKHMVQSLLEVNRMWDKPLVRRWMTGREIEAYLREHLQLVADAKSVTMRMEGQDSSLDADPELLLLAVENLVSNAIRYSPSGKEVVVSFEQPLASLTTLSVCDQGIGIDPIELPFIFEPFYRSEEATAWDQEGSGLGLAIVKQVADLHGAELRVESEPGTGTCISMTFHNKTVTKPPSS